ncbi:DUF981 family protein [Planctomycetota bacterium]
MFVDYVTLMLVNMAAGLTIFSYYLYRGFDGGDPHRFVPGFAISGLVATVTGLHMCFTWPLPGPYNSAFGETSVLLGALFLGAALCLARGWKMHALGFYAWFAGAAAAVIGIRIMSLGLTKTPTLAGIGFLLTSVPGLFLGVVIALRKFRTFRLVIAAITYIAALLWAYVGYKGIWGHMDSFGKWLPETMR